MTELEKEMKRILLHHKKTLNLDPDRIEVIFTAWGFYYQLKNTASNIALSPQGFRYSGELTKDEEETLMEKPNPHSFVYYDLTLY